MIRSSFLIHGHRGCRGLFPENTIPAFIHAIQLGVDAVELDVVLTADNKVLVSHEPWFSHEHCRHPSGKNISEAEEKNLNIYKMNYEQVKNFDCGSGKHSRFPHQKNFPAYKPLLTEVIKACLPISENIFFNIEIKSDPRLYNIYQPIPSVMVAEVMKVVKESKIERNCLLQSFDYNILKELNSKYPDVKCALLVEDNANPQMDFKKLGFIPYGYNVQYRLITPGTVNFCKENNVQILAWTVNEKDDMKSMAELDVSGIITDYPDRALCLFR